MKKKNYRSLASSFALTDTGDRRSGDSDTYASRWARARYYRLKAAGICVRCGQTKVLGRAYCFACVDAINGYGK